MTYYNILSNPIWVILYNESQHEDSESIQDCSRVSVAPRLLAESLMVSVEGGIFHLKGVDDMMDNTINMYNM